MKKILALIMCACMLLCFAACGQTPEETTAQTDPVVETTLPTANENPVYTVKVVDEEGNPIAGAMVQVCSENCYPAATNEEGVAVFSVVEDEYKVSFISVPAGYALAGDATEFYFEDGVKEMTITLKAAE